jgi:hypothetical protein
VLLNRTPTSVVAILLRWPSCFLPSFVRAVPEALSVTTGDLFKTRKAQKPLVAFRLIYYLFKKIYSLQLVSGKNDRIKCLQITVRSGILIFFPDPSQIISDKSAIITKCGPSSVLVYRKLLQEWPDPFIKWFDEWIPNAINVLFLVQDQESNI